MRTSLVYRNFCLRVSAAIALAACLSFPSAAGWAQNASPAAGQSAGDLQANVTAALAHDPALAGQQVTATVDHGIVTLNGTVQTEQQSQAAETAAANVQGVSGIQNNLKVTNPGAGTQNAAPSAAAQMPPAPADDEQAPPPPDEAQQPAGYPQQAPPAGTAAGNPPPPPPPDQQAGQPRPAYGGYNNGGYNNGYNNYPEQQPVSGPVTVPAGTLLQVRTVQPLDMSRLQDGATFQATAASDVFEGNVLAIPRGATLEGTVVHVKKPGSLGGNGEIQIQLTSVTLGGRMYPLTTDLWSNKSPNKAGYTAGNTAAGAVLGAVIGGIIGRGPGAAAGAIVGGGAGMAASAASNPRAILPPEALLNFHLTNPVTVQPVSWQEARRLEQNVPQLQQRRRVVYMAPPYPYPYGYPYPYYRYGW